MTTTDINWRRIAEWAERIADDDLSPVQAIYDKHSLPAPVVVWDPPEESLVPEPLGFLLGHWRSLARETGMPHWRQIDPVNLGPALGYVMLVEPVDNGRDFLCRLYGSMLAGISGFDMTGKYISQLKASAYVVEFSVATYRAAWRRRIPVFTTRHPADAVATTAWQRIIMPLADDHGALARFLVGNVPVDREGRIIRAPY